jgi:serine/threonine-protein kinase
MFHLSEAFLINKRLSLDKNCMIGTVISQRYQILQSLGSGGFGQTFLAKDLQLPDHPKCVVKRLKPATDDQNIWKIAGRLFEAEARVLHKLGNHDRIPRLFAHFQEAHEFYLVQEFIEGDDLTNELISTARDEDGYPVGRMDESQATIFLLDVLEILAFVHQQGAIHRDIKPANLMRRRSDKNLVLIDFGAVKQLETRAAIASTVAIGTDGYMPNEQAIGKPRPCSDLYAVGAIAIQGLTGVPPSVLGEDLETGELAWRQSPDAASYKYRTNVSDAFAGVINKLVKYDFRDRYQSAEEALVDVRQLALPIAPTILQNYNQSNSQTDFAANTQELTAIARLEENPTAPRDYLHLKHKEWNWLGIRAIALVSVIAVIGGLIFLRPFPILKTDVNSDININSVSPSPKYLFLSERAIANSDLVGKSALELDIMRNEVFARYGRRFQDPELQAYFMRQPWYQPRYPSEQFPENLLTSIEMQNVMLISSFQVKMAQNGNPSTTSNSLCDYNKRLISDPNPPINVRTGAGVDYAIVGTLDNGTQITVKGEKQGWLQISEPIAGWVAANRTKPMCF